MNADSVLLLHLGVLEVSNTFFMLRVQQVYPRSTSKMTKLDRCAVGVVHLFPSFTGVPEKSTPKVHISEIVLQVYHLKISKY